MYLTNEIDHSGLFYRTIIQSLYPPIRLSIEVCVLLHFLTHARLRGGLVVADRLPRDSQGALLVSLDKLDKGVVGVSEFNESDKYLQDNVTHV